MWFATLYYTVHLWESEVVHMIETSLLLIIELLCFGLIADTIIVFALLILVIMLSK